MKLNVAEVASYFGAVVTTDAMRMCLRGWTESFDGNRWREALLGTILNFTVFFRFRRAARASQDVQRTPNLCVLRVCWCCKRPNHQHKSTKKLKK